MKASELIKKLIEAIVSDGDRDVWLNVGSIQPIGEVFSNGLSVYLRSETVTADIAAAANINQSSLQKENTMKEETIITALKIAQMIEGDSEVPATIPVDSTAPEWVIVRGDRSGVFYGLMTNRSGTEVTLKDARHIWYWAGAANTAEIANSGVSKPDKCKIVAPVARLLVLDAIEVLTCTQAAINSLDAVPAWSQR